MSRQRVLMFAYYFPPLGGGGVQRTLKHVKYLPEFGFDSIVVAGNRGGYALQDASLLSEVPAGTIVSRARALPLRLAQWKLSGLLRRLGITDTIVNRMLWPDDLVGWLPAAVYHGMRAARTHKPTVIYSSSSPVTAHLAALVVHMQTGLPWVADFRDAWMMNPFQADSPATCPTARISAALEGKIAAEASYLTVVDDTVAVLGVPAADPRRVVIPNGVDEEDLPTNTNGAVRNDDRQTFRLAHVGSLYGERDAAPVIEAIRRLIELRRVDPAQFELRVVGHANLRGVSIDSVPATFTGYVDHKQALREMATASALLFYQPPGCHGSSGKVYEYLASGRPILGVADADNLGYRLVERLGGGKCANVRDPADVQTAIVRMLSDWERGALSVDPNAKAEALRRFSRRAAAGTLADVLGAAISGSTPQQRTQAIAGTNASSARPAPQLRSTTAA